ncbi:MAG: methyltransferase domain-containing protein [Betaproteobacteria bacterium]|nr:methyltransferase domain-containing protein [Betaproteobacteria bacterium]
MSKPIDEKRLAEAHSRQWFYEFELPDGSQTKSYLPPGVEKVHDTRREMLDSVLDAELGSECSNLTAVDLACHQGWFALQLARRGFRRVLCVDERESHLDDTRLMAELAEARNIDLQRCDLEDATVADIGVHDVTLMLGLLYHLENPVRALRLARAVTRKILVIETQVVPHMGGMVDWGSYLFRRPLMGVFGVIDETGETHANEASARGICLAPSIETLEWMLRRVGFADVRIVPVPEGGYEQLTGKKRVMMLARVES